MTKLTVRKQVRAWVSVSFSTSGSQHTCDVHQWHVMYQRANDLHCKIYLIATTSPSSEYARHRVTGLADVRGWPMSGHVSDHASAHRAGTWKSKRETLAVCRVLVLGSWVVRLVRSGSLGLDRCLCKEIFGTHPKHHWCLLATTSIPEHVQVHGMQRAHARNHPHLVRASPGKPQQSNLIDQYWLLGWSHACEAEWETSLEQ